MRCIVYSSTAIGDVTTEALRDILDTSRRNNVRDDLTGLLLFRDGRFLQLLEGPAEMIDRRMGAIVEDPRHMNVATLLDYETERRQFPDWTMGFDSPRDQTTHLPGYRSRLADLFTAPASSYGPLMPALRELMRWYQTRPSLSDH